VSDAPRQLAGDVAISVALAVTQPLREVCDRLALLVDGLERFVTSSTGPTPYPYKSLQTLRNDVTDAYLHASVAARRLIDLESVLAADRSLGTLDVRREVELGVALAQHQVDRGTELLVDVLDVPLARGNRGVLALAVAQLLALCAASAQRHPGSTITVRVSLVATQRAMVMVADNGAGFDQPPALVAELATALGVAPRDVVAAVEPEQGCVFELYFDLAP